MLKINTQMASTDMATPVICNTSRWLRRPASSLFGHVVTEVTPALAARWLASQNSNRNTIPRAVDMISRAIRNGSYMSEVCIYFLADGSLCDGQHRLQAIVATGESTWITLAFGCRAGLQNVLDDGTKRTGSQALSITEGASSAVGKCASTLLRMISNTERRSNLEVCGTYDANKPLIDYASLIYGVRLVGLPGKRLSAVDSVALAVAHHFDPTEIDEFIQRICNGNTPQGTPERALLDYWSRLQGGVRDSNHAVWWKVLYCCWHSVKGNPLQRVFASAPAKDGLPRENLKNRPECLATYYKTSRWFIQ